MSNERCCVPLSLSHARYAFAHGWTVTELPNPRRWFEGGLWLGCARLCGTGCLWEVRQVVSLSNDFDSTVASRFKQLQAVGLSQAVNRHAPLLSAMEEILHGSVWCMVNHLLTTDDAVMLRTVTSRLIEENKFGIGILFLDDAET